MARTATLEKLSTYQAIRDFSQSPEPSGGSPGAEPDHGFVIQQHAARRMHYDFRLELDGVLLSWSVPKGPSLSPADRRLAVRTEDHPLEYASFEGIIPQGQYGGGTVVVWDRGTWEPEGDAREGVAKGRLTFTLHGEKLRGRWHLVRTRTVGRVENWLLFKGRDEAADDQLDILTARPASVLSGRTLDEIATAPERVWQSTRAAAPTVAEKRAARIAAARSSGPHTGGPHTGGPHTGGPHTGGPHTGKAGTRHDDVLALVEQLQSPLGFKLTNLDKVLYPDQGITKGDLIAYFAVVADWALPHIANRPLTLLRCPEGVRGHAETERSPERRAKPEAPDQRSEGSAESDGRGGRMKYGRLASRGQKPCFFQKHLSPGSPPPIEAVPIVEDGTTADYMQIHDMPGLVGLAQLGSLEIHTWGAHADEPEKPDLLVFDLDPDVGLAWDRVALGAFELRRRLHDAGLESFVKTTGSKGLHIAAPVARGIAWDELKAFSKALAQAMEHDEPARYTANLAKTHRKDKIFIDYLRNGRGATFVAPYSPRALPGAPVATPVGWEELAHGVDPAAFTTATVPRRLAALSEDPWKAMAGVEQAITERAWRSVGGTR